MALMWFLVALAGWALASFVLGLAADRILELFGMDDESDVVG